ncbi:MAG: RHS repeat-associated core domain-containing protein [Verrucomicrobiota bacterium]
MKALTLSVAISVISALTAFGQGAWQTQFIQKPSYQGVPIPSEYNGMSLNELLDVGHHNYSLPALNPLSYRWADGNGDGLGDIPSNVSSELRGHEMLDQLVEDLAGDPIALAAFVQNEIDLTNTFVYGALPGEEPETRANQQLVRGALGTYMEKQGSPWEQCALLVHLLRRAGYPTAYVKSTSATSNQGLWLLTRHVNNMLGLHLIEGADIDSSLLHFQFPWVIVYTDKSGSNGEWVHLFPWIKDTVVEEGLDPYGYFPAGYDSGKKWAEKYLTNDSAINNLIGNDGRDTAALLFERYLQQQVADDNLSVDDFGLNIYNRTNHYWDWSDFPQPLIIGDLTDANFTEPLIVKTNDLKDAADDARFAKIKFEIQTAGGGSTLIETQELKLADLHNRRFYAFYKPGTNKIALELSPFDESVSLSTGNFSSSTIWARQYKEVNDPGSALEIKISVSGMQTDVLPDEFTRNFKDNSLAAICYNAGRVTQEMLDVHARKFWEMERASTTPPVQDYVGVNMFMTGLTFWMDEEIENRQLMNLHKVHTTLRYGVCVASIEPTPGSGNTNWTTPSVDIPINFRYLRNQSHHPFSSETVAEVQEDILFLDGINGSSHEHQALNTFFGQENAISTVQLLRLANERHAPTEGNNGQGFYSFTRSEFAAADAAADADPLSTFGVLRTEAGDAWDTVYEAFGLDDAGYTPAGWESAYITPFDIAMSGDANAYNGMGVLYMAPEKVGALIDGQAAGGAGSSLPSSIFQSSNFDNLSLTQNFTGNYTLGNFGTGGTDFFSSGVTTNNDAISFFSGIDSGSFGVDSFSETSWSTGYSQLGFGSAGGNIGTAGETLFSTGWLGETSWNSFGGQGNSFVIDPVNVVNGEFYIDTIDLTIPGPLSLEIRRNYGSMNESHNLLGYGWKFTLMPYINITQSGDLIYAAEPDGSVVAYRKVVSSSPERWEPEPTDNEQLNNFNGGDIGGQTNPFSAYIEKTTDGSDEIYKLYKANGHVAKYKVRSFPVTDGTDTITRERPYLEEWRDPFGNALDFFYYEDNTLPECGQLRRIESSNGNFLGFVYNVRSQVTEIFTNDGRRVNYAYDGFGDMISVTLPDNSTIKYDYQILLDADENNEPYSTHLLTKITKPDGRLVVNEYDSQYDPKDATFSDPMYRRVSKQYMTVGLDLTPVEVAEFEYNPNGDPWVTAGFDVTYVHSDVRPALGRVTTAYVHKDGIYYFIADPLATSFAPGNTDIDYVVTYNWFDGTEPNSFVRSIKTLKDKRGMKTHYEYDAVGSVRKVSIEGDVTGDGVSETVPVYYFFDADKHYLRKVIRPAPAPGLAQKVTYHTYPTISGGADYEEDSSNPGTYLYAYLPTKSAEYAIVNPAINALEPSATDRIQERTFRYGRVIGTGEEAHGLLLRSTSQSDLDVDDKTETSWTYSAKGFAETRTQKTFTSAPDIVTTYEYNPKGELIRESDPAGRTGRFDYDMMGRLKSSTQYASDSSNDALSWNITYYNQHGEVTWEDGPRFNPEDYVFRDYDGGGRVIAEVRWRSQAKSDGSGIEAVPGQDTFLGQAITYFEYDGFGSLVSTLDPRGNETAMGYDELGRNNSITHAVGTTDVATESFTHEPGGQVYQHTNTLSGVTTTLYTITGQPRQKTLPDNRVTQWHYYLDGRVKTRTLSNDAVWTHTYDDTSLTETRILAKGSDTLAKLVVGYDTRRNTVSLEEFATDSVSYVTETEFDGVDRVVRQLGPPAATHPDSGQPASSLQETTINYVYGTTVPFQVQTTIGDVLKVENFDALNRPTAIGYLDANTFVTEDETGFAYDDNHSAVTEFRVLRVGAQSANTLITKNYTDTFGNTVLTVFADNTKSRQVYDAAGNLTNSFDELQLETQFSHDSRNRLLTTTKPDSSQVTLNYDDANNIVKRIMPGNLTWEAQFDSALRMSWEQLRGTGANISRRVDFNYYTTGDNIGLLNTRIENSGSADQITHTFDYDGALRIKETTSTAANYPDITLARSFDLRGLTTFMTRSSPSDADLIPSVRIARLYDGYKQIIDEKVEIGAGSGNAFNSQLLHSHLVQVWDASGRRETLQMGEGIPAKGSWTPTMDFDFIASGMIDQIIPATASNSWALDFEYSTNGQLNRSYTNVWYGGGASVYEVKRTHTISNGFNDSLRDARGRVLKRDLFTELDPANDIYAFLFRNTLVRDSDGKISSCTSLHTNGTGSNWATLNETRTYTYDPQNRRLATETFQPTPESPLAMETLKYTFDDDDLGVRIKAENQTDSATLWEADPSNNGLDAFKRIAEEDRVSDFYSFIAQGDAVGPGKFSLWIGQGVSPTTWDFVNTVFPDPDYGSGQWQVPLSLPDGQYTLRAEAEHSHPSSSFTSTSTSTFTIAAGGEQRTVSNTYDYSGKLIARSWASGQVTQNMTWDAGGKLVKVVQADTRTTPLLPDYTWTAIYDGGGRRIKTTFVPSNAPQAGAEAARAIHCWYDPSIEFLEVAVETQGKRWWKFHGPDLDADYGSFQGVGGLEAVVDEESGAFYPIIDDNFGNVVGHVNTGTLDNTGDDVFLWTEIQMSGYGPLPGYQMKALEESGDLVLSLAWQGRRIDPTGLFCMGTRYYDPISGSFISTDPLGHEATLDLYSYAGGDPINFFDPTGRFPKGEDGVVHGVDFTGEKDWSIGLIRQGQLIVKDPDTNFFQKVGGGILTAAGGFLSIPDTMEGAQIATSQVKHEMNQKLETGQIGTFEYSLYRSANFFGNFGLGTTDFTTGVFVDPVNTALDTGKGIAYDFPVKIYSDGKAFINDPSYISFVDNFENAVNIGLIVGPAKRNFFEEVGHSQFRDAWWNSPTPGAKGLLSAETRGHRALSEAGAWIMSAGKNGEPFPFAFESSVFLGAGRSKERGGLLSGPTDSVFQSAPFLLNAANSATVTPMGSNPSSRP